MLRILPDTRAATLLHPVREALDKALRLLPGGPAVAVRVAALDAPYVVGTASQPEVVLSDQLLGPDIHAPWEIDGPLPPLDRWRRAAASVLEGVALIELARRTDTVPDLSDWRWVGAAVYVAHATAAELSLAQPDMAHCLMTGDLAANPRAGVAAYLAWRQVGMDPIQQAQYLLEGGVVSAQEWVKIGGWIFDPVGMPSLLPVPVRAVTASDIPTSLGPWSWRPLKIPAHRRGGRIGCEGHGGVKAAWAPANEPLATLAGSTDGPSTFVPEAGGPVGRWEVASAEAFGQIVGARGIQFHFLGDGRLELILADAFVGPLAAVAMADELGTSGVTQGRWCVRGASLLGFEGIARPTLTMHGRTSGGFAMPTGGFGLERWLEALCEAPWAWKAMPDRLVLRGSMRGGTVEVRLRPA